MLIVDFPGCLGLENEGWFSPWALMTGFKHKAQSLGVEYIDAELVNFVFNDNNQMTMVGAEDNAYKFPHQAIVRLNSGDVKNITFAYCIIATGAGSPGLQQILKLGQYGTGMRSIPLPLIQR